MMRANTALATSARRAPKIAKSVYRSARARSWRNVMVSAINAGLEQGVFGIRPGENYWPDSAGDANRMGAGGGIYRFTFGDEIPAMAWVGDAGWDELSVHVALWPTPDAERWVICWNAGRTAGDVFATGWLERRRAPYLQETANLITGRREGLAAASVAEVEPLRALYCDHGRLIF